MATGLEIISALAALEQLTMSSFKGVRQINKAIKNFRNASDDMHNFSSSIFNMYNVLKVFTDGVKKCEELKPALLQDKHIRNLVCGTISCSKTTQRSIQITQKKILAFMRDCSSGLWQTATWTKLLWTIKHRHPVEVVVTQLETVKLDVLVTTTLLTFRRRLCDVEVLRSNDEQIPEELIEEIKLMRQEVAMLEAQRDQALRQCRILEDKFTLSSSNDHSHLVAQLEEMSEKLDLVHLETKDLSRRLVPEAGRKRRSNGTNRSSDIRRRTGSDFSTSLRNQSTVMSSNSPSRQQNVNDRIGSLRRRRPWHERSDLAIPVEAEIAPPNSFAEAPVQPDFTVAVVEHPHSSTTESTESTEEEASPIDDGTRTPPTVAPAADQHRHETTITRDRIHHSHRSAKNDSQYMFVIYDNGQIIREEFRQPKTRRPRRSTRTNSSSSSISSSEFNRSTSPSPQS